MKSLEITALEDKKLTVYLVEKEYNEPFWLVEPSSNGSSKSLRHLFRPSIAFNRFLEKLTEQVKPDFATEELGMRSSEEFKAKNTLAQLFQKKKVPFVPVDIDENARGYLSLEIEEKLEARDKVLEALVKLSKAADDNVKKEYLVSYGQCLQLELQERQHEVGFSVRENWIVMGILDHARETGDKENLRCIHISSPEHVKGIQRLLESLDVNVQTLKLSKKTISSVAKTSDSEEISDLLQSMQILAKPVIKKSSDEAPYILFYLDTDERASSFDICMAYDAGFKAVIPYENVSVEDAKRIVQDAMFSRGPKGIKHTAFFIGGKDSEKAEEVLEKMRNTMFPPFETGIIVDPSGAYTTAAAAVAKVEEAMSSQELGSLGDKTCAVFGTGPVGRIIAVLLTRIGCHVMIISPNPKRTNGEEYVQSISRLLSSKYGANVNGGFAPTKPKKAEILRKADVIFCASTEGVRVIEKDLLEDLKLLKVMADINAVPPLGVEGIKLEDNMREIAPGIFGIGALTIGKLKYKLEKEILKEIRRNGNEIYNYNFALQFARKLLRKELSISKLAVTLKYPDRPKK